MSRFALAAALVAVVAVSACSAAPNEPSVSPSPTPASPSAPPSVSPPATPAPTPVPTATPPPATPAPAVDDFTVTERYLLDGILRGAVGCAPASGSDELPRNAIAGIECASNDPAVARIGFYLFDNEEDALNAYLLRMAAEGVAVDSGSCSDGEGEHAYMPGPGLVPYRNGCFINADGFANYRATLPGSHVYIGILGRSGNTRALEDFAWLGNQDTPGNPTLWAEPY